MTRGVVYIVWGNTPPVLERSVQSVRQWHPELPVKVFNLPGECSLLDKSRMADLSPFDSTLVLDADTVVLDRLDHGFTMAELHGLACCVCECPWARRYAWTTGDHEEFNTGVLFWTARARPVFDAWQRLCGTLDSSITFEGEDGKVCRMPLNDQGPFAAAIAETGFNPWVLPLNWNMRPQWQHDWFGQVKIWHDYRPVPPQLLDVNANQTAPGAMIRHSRFKS